MLLSSGGSLELSEQLIKTVRDNIIIDENILEKISIMQKDIN